MAEASVPLLSEEMAAPPDFSKTKDAGPPGVSLSPSDSDGILAVDPYELEGLSQLEKKFVLINREIDRNGMGRYQWYIWFLCGFGYLLDLLWAQAFGLVLGTLEQELGFQPDQTGNISVAFSAGLTAGAFVWGVLVDIIGRRWAFNLTCLISAAFGLGLGGCNTYTAFLVVTAFVGFGIGGNIPIDTTICLEFIPQNRRFLLALLSIFQPIGVVITCVLALAYIPTYSCKPNFSEPNPLKSCNMVAPGEPCCTKASNMGWRYLLYTLGSITLGVFFLRFVVFNFQESPKFLVYHGREEEAVQVLQHVARVNGKTCNLTLADFHAVGGEPDPLTQFHQRDASGATPAATWKQLVFAECARYRMLVSNWRMVWLTSLIWLTYICDFWGFTLAGAYAPLIIAYKNGGQGLGLEASYRSYVAIYTPGIVGVVLGAMMYGVPMVGRKWTMVFASALMGTSIFIFSAVDSEAANTGVNVMEYFFQSMFNAVLYGWTPEVYPAPIRGTACGVASFWATTRLPV